MIARRTTLASYLVVCSFILACAGRHPTPEALAADDSPAAAPEPVVLEVENHNWADVVLYVVHDGVQTRFTQVAAAHNVAAAPGSDGGDSPRGPPDRRHRQLRVAGNLNPGKHRGSIDDRKQPQPLQRRSLVESISRPGAACFRRFRKDRRLPSPPETPRRLWPPPSKYSSVPKSCSSPRSRCPPKGSQSRANRTCPVLDLPARRDGLRPPSTNQSLPAAFPPTFARADQSSAPDLQLPCRSGEFSRRDRALLPRRGLECRPCTRPSSRTALTAGPFEPSFELL
jgi:hypothetical protein